MLKLNKKGRLIDAQTGEDMSFILADIEQVVSCSGARIYDRYGTFVYLGQEDLYDVFLPLSFPEWLREFGGCLSTAITFGYTPVDVYHALVGEEVALCN